MSILGRPSRSPAGSRLRRRCWGCTLHKMEPKIQFMSIHAGGAHKEAGKSQIITALMKHFEKRVHLNRENK
uniref:Uncharacterized protein n=1 Tax=Oryza barthii TaxID=65489 RepID=A0A0D3EKU9_9ORYZ